LLDYKLSSLVLWQLRVNKLLQLTQSVNTHGDVDHLGTFDAIGSSYVWIRIVPARDSDNSIDDLVKSVTETLTA
jgi:beta-lactamase superfamily II metal-dependent hydrolase